MGSNIEFVSRSGKDAEPWFCSSCYTINMPIQKRVLKIPRFFCEGEQCGKRFLESNAHKFSLADVEVNGEPLVQRVLKQEGPECVANVLAQSLDVMHRVNYLYKGKQPVSHLMFKPQRIYDPYNTMYQRRKSVSHKVIKMLLKLRSEGIELDDGTFYKIGDASTIPGDAYEAICEQLADGYALIGTIIPGNGFEYHKYGQMYRPPLTSDVFRCNEQCGSHKDHPAHAVVLLGPDLINGEQGFECINSYGEKFSKRTLLQDKPKAVKSGLFTVPAKDLMLNVVKLWEPGSSCIDESRLEEEDGDGNKLANKYRILGTHGKKQW